MDSQEPIKFYRLIVYLRIGRPLTCQELGPLNIKDYGIQKGGSI
jgi:hypothetical protein